MANVYSLTTHEYIVSANTPSYPPEDWWIGIDVSAVIDVPIRYRKYDGGGLPVEMTQAEKDAVDAADLIAQRDAAVAQLQQTEDILRAFMLTVLDEFNTHATKTNAILDAVDGASDLSQLKTTVAGIADYPARTEQQLRTSIRGKLGS